MSELLIVDNEPEIHKAIRRELMGTHWNVTGVSSPVDGLALLGTTQFDVVIAENRLQDMDGIEFLTRVRLHDPGIVRIVLSGHADTGVMLRSVNNAGVFKFVVKPWEPDELKDVLFEAEVQRHRARQTQALLEEIQTRELQSALSGPDKDSG